MKKIHYLLLIIASLILLFSFFNFNFKEGGITKRDRESESGRQNPETFVYESEADSEEECTSYESYDNIDKVCYFECESEEDCKDLEDSVNAELDSWLEVDPNQKEDVTNEKTEKNISSEDPSLMAEYYVSKGEEIKIKKGKTGGVDAEIWKSISRISPNTLSDKYIDTFQVFNNKDDSTLAFVDDEDLDGKWRIAINLAGYNSSTFRERNLTIVHELGHIITLNVDQIDDKNICDSYKTAEGCTQKNSYLNLFVNKFWSSSDIKKSKQENNNLYQENKYLTEYASSNPEEDMSESFAFFVVDKKKDIADLKLIKNQKHNFYYSFPELENMRSEMRKGLSENIIREKLRK